MAYVELYSDELLNTVDLGYNARDFNPSNGDYIKVEVLQDLAFDVVLGTFYSNRLLFKTSDVDELYADDYHYHPENPQMGFCSGKYHDDNNFTQLLPIPTEDGGTDKASNPSGGFKKQIDIFKDDNNNIYIKPNEILKLIKLRQGRYKIRVYFLRNIKSKLANFLKLNKDNLVENGNFFAGLEATQTGDIDRSNGRNNFISMENPGFSKFVLEQDGINNNTYKMKITGIEPNSSYIFSCWVSWNANFNGDAGLVYFSNANSTNSKKGFIDVQNTDLAGSWIEKDGSKERILGSKRINGLNWYRAYKIVSIGEDADLNSFLIHLGRNDIQGWSPSSNPKGRRYFTDLRLEKLLDVFGTDTMNKIDKLKKESLS
tara:strand:+ start:2767 stop:3882 length:1116 start_codon:yes stop_codon:yes gene_type:complete